MADSDTLFSHHPRAWAGNRYVYPVVSRRGRGLSIGINLNPDKVCNFDCVYCCVDRTVPPAVCEVDLPTVEAELDHLLTLAADGSIWRVPPFDRADRELRRLNDVAFSGDGEPTAYGRFADACRLVAARLGAHGLSDVRIVTITNATLLHRPGVIEALAFLDGHNGELWAKLDAGTGDYFRRIERTAIGLDRVLANILSAGRVRPIVIQSMFLELGGEGPGESEISAYLRRLTDLREGGCQIKGVQVYTVARSPADERVGPLSCAALADIAGRIEGLGLHAEWFGK